jgi:hypothetical protein
MEHPDIFLITSVINTGSVPWNYSAVRSFFSPNERFEQTLRSIQSIKDLCDNNLIVLAECSDIPEEWEDQLRSQVDIFLQLKEDEEVKNACLNSEKKGYGEVCQTLRAVESIKKAGVVFNRLFKLSGRYWLNEHFKKDIFSTECYTFQEFTLNRSGFCTVLYSVPSSLFDEFTRIVDECSMFYKNNHSFYEYYFPSKCNPKLVLTCTIGVSGRIAINNQLFTS